MVGWSPSLGRSPSNYRTTFRALLSIVGGWDLVCWFYSQMQDRPRCYGRTVTLPRTVIIPRTRHYISGAEGPRTSAPSTPFWTLSIVPVSPLTLWKTPLAPRPWHSERLPSFLAPRSRPQHLTSPRRKSLKSIWSMENNVFLIKEMLSAFHQLNFALYII